MYQNFNFIKQFSELYTKNDAQHKLLGKVLQVTRDTLKIQSYLKFKLARFRRGAVCLTKKKMK